MKVERLKPNSYYKQPMNMNDNPRLEKVLEAWRMLTIAIDCGKNYVIWDIFTGSKKNKPIDEIYDEVIGKYLEVEHVHFGRIMALYITRTVGVFTTIPSFDYYLKIKNKAHM